MKKIFLAAIAAVSAGTAMAGSITFTPPVATAIEEPARMGGSGAWLIPLIIIAVIALAVSNPPAGTDPCATTGAGCG